VAVLSKTLVWGHMIAGIASSNPADGMNFRVLSSLCVVQVAASAMSWLLVQRSTNGYVCLILTIKANEMHYFGQTVNVTSMTNTNCCEYSIKTPDDGQ
jgi:hypothetical protein